MKQFKKLFFLFLQTGICALFVGCASPSVDRSFVNDPAMDLQKKSKSAEVSPSSGLNNRSKANGGSTCSVCAH